MSLGDSMPSLNRSTEMTLQQVFVPLLKDLSMVFHSQLTLKLLALSAATLHFAEQNSSGRDLLLQLTHS